MFTYRVFSLFKLFRLIDPRGYIPVLHKIACTLWGLRLQALVDVSICSPSMADFFQTAVLGDYRRGFVASSNHSTG